MSKKIKLVVCEQDDLCNMRIIKVNKKKFCKIVGLKKSEIKDFINGEYAFDSVSMMLFENGKSENEVNKILSELKNLKSSNKNYLGIL